MALAAKMDAAPYRVFTLLGDGELVELVPEEGFEPPTKGL